VREINTRPHSDPRGEQGATIVIVALVLIAMFGMMVLVVDVGGLLWKRRELVNGSDAAALSAAATCAVKNDSRTAEQAADELAADNVTGLNPTSVSNATVGKDGSGPDPSACHGTTEGWVKVQYSQQQHLFFAPVLGFANQNGVTTKAAAIWGPPGSASSVPIAIYTNSFGSNCDIENLPPPPAPPTQCFFWFDNDGFGTSRFGLLDLTPSPSGGWDVPADQQQCPNPNGGKDTLRGWIDGSIIPDTLGVHYPDPTYVCVLSGMGSGPIWDALDSRVGDTVTFPINRCESTVPNTDVGGQVSSNGTEVACSTAPHKYDIIGFVDFRLTAVLQSAAQWGGIPLTTCSKNNLSVPPTPQAPISLFGFNSANCPDATQQGTATIDESSILIDGRPITDTSEFTYDSFAKSFTWTAAPKKVDVSFKWWVNGQCGPPPPNDSAVCIKVESVEVRLGGGDPGGGSPLSNLRAVKLCDPVITGSCAPVNVPT
jgi:Putative Flp pilus-assembly TadE/G-like